MAKIIIFIIFINSLIQFISVDITENARNIMTSLKDNLTC